MKSQTNAQLAEKGRRYLERISEARQRVDELTLRIHHHQRLLDQAAESLRFRMPPNDDPPQPGIRALLGLIHRLNDELEGYAARVREAEWAIDQLENPMDRLLLRQHFFCGMNYENLAACHHYSDPRSIRRLISNALSRLRTEGFCGAAEVPEAKNDAKAI